MTNKNNPFGKVGKRIKEYRNKKGLTQKQLAEKIEKSERMLQKYENGEVTPSYKILKKIVGVLGITLHDLIGLSKPIPLKYIEYLFEKGISLKELSEDTGIPENRLHDILADPDDIGSEDIELLFNDLEEVVDFISVETLVSQFDSIDVYNKIENNSRNLTKGKLDLINGSIKWTDEELELINEFKDFLLMRRKKKKNNQ